MRVERVEPLPANEYAQKEQKQSSRKKREDSSVLSPSIDEFICDTFVQIAKKSPISREALDILLMLEVGEDIARNLEENL
jgi:hypothetical protein